MTKNIGYFILSKFILLIFLFGNLAQANTLYENTKDKSVIYWLEDLEQGIKNSNVNRVKRALSNFISVSTKDREILLSLANETIKFRRNNVDLAKRNYLTGERQERSWIGKEAPSLIAAAIFGSGVYAALLENDPFFIPVSAIVGLMTLGIWTSIRDYKDNHILYHNSVEIRKLIQQL